MKKKIVIILLLLSVSFGYSQIAWNLKAGMNLSKVTPMDMNEMKQGYQFGVGMDYYFNNHWGIHPSLMLISKGYKEKVGFGYVTEYDGFERGLKSYSITSDRIYIEIPAMLAYRFNVSNTVRLVLNGGGYFSCGVAGRFKKNNAYEDGSIEKINTCIFSAGVSRLDAGLGAGTILEYKNRYILNLFGEWGLKNVHGATKNRTFGFNVGYKF